MNKIERSDSIRRVQAVDVVLSAVPRPSAASPNVVLAIVCVGICLANLDLFIVNVALFTAASAACAAANNVEMLIAFRVLQAAGAALMTPTSLGLLLAVFPPE